MKNKSVMGHVIPPPTSTVLLRLFLGIAVAISAMCLVAVVQAII
ncbi:hypothetical protein [Thalassobium sp. R2A62]|jgi:hypothetical protein|nr:hypothetical protein [Thalassobium sp. R2A62]EET49462.1 hypothetical protein TR2A62_0442 [Thalassobium sp. R2A62]MDG2452361.1 hypothetical protein [Paracoccaceae bacterium]